MGAGNTPPPLLVLTSKGRLPLKDESFYGVEYRPLSDREKNEIQNVLATGNLTIESLANKDGMAWEKRDLYREVILKRLRKHPGCSDAEVKACRSIHPRETAAILAIEGVKHRLFEGFIARLTQLAKSKLYMAKWFTTENTSHVRRDLEGETMTAFCHAVYHFNRYDRAFNTFLTTVVNNWLTEYCERLSPVKLTEMLKDDLALFYSIKSERRRKKLQPLSFEETIRIIVTNELRDKKVAATPRNIEEAIERGRERFMTLQQATRRILQVDDRYCPGTTPTGDEEALLNDLAQNLSPLERRTLQQKLKGDSLRDLAVTEGISAEQVGRAFRRAKEVVAAALV